MDFERETKLRNIRVIISECFMVIAVIIIVAILVLVASGYWVNENLEVERTGLLQLSSVPTGADFAIDGESSLFQKTNASKMISSGEHEVTISKEGYDTWTKTVEIKEGLLYRLHYPRLFLQERTKEEKGDVSDVTKVSVSDTHTYALAVNETTEWDFINLDNENLETKTIDISDIFSTVSVADGAKKGAFTGDIKSMKWNIDGNRVLFNVCKSSQCEWILLNVPNTKNSINLTKTFGINFDEIMMVDNSANTLLTFKDGKLRKINVSNSSISGILAENVKSFDYYDGEIAYVSCIDNEGCMANILKNNDEVEEVKEVSSNAKIFLGKFYDDKYLTLIYDNSISVYKKDNYEKAEFYNELEFMPTDIKVGHNDEFIVMKSGRDIATFDMESGTLSNWFIEGNVFGWIDNDMAYTISNGDLIVYDFDGLNRRVIAKNVSNYFPVLITNDKWLYYVSDDSLVREWLINH